MPKKLQSRKELLAHLAEQVGFIDRSCKHFDEGHVSEGKRLASGVRLFAHETTNSKSLLKQIGKNHIRFMASGYEFDPLIQQTNYMRFEGLNSLTMMSDPVAGMTSKYTVLPAETVEARWLKFSEWWDEIVFALPRGGARYSRRDVVLYLANKDGGSHVDPAIEEKFVALYDISRQNAQGWTTVSNGVESKPTEGPELSAARVIAGELLQSLERSGWRSWA